MNQGICEKERAGLALTIIGLGNIGSQLIPLIAFHPLLKRVVLVDKDHYERANITTQRITRHDLDLGRPKAIVQARCLRALNPALAVHPIVDDVSNIPMGLLRGDLMIACVDSLEARIQINQIAWRLGVPWLDGGVEPRQHLVRVEGYLPKPENPCFECSLSDEDYRSLGSRQPCQPPARLTAPTNGPASLGALAAALLAEETAKILSHRHDTALLGRQIILGTDPHTHMVSTLRRNPQCRFNHATWQLASIRGLWTGLTLRKALALLGATADSTVALALAGKSFALALRCPGCGAKLPGLHIVGRLAAGASTCRRCRKEMLVSGLDLMPKVDSSLAPEVLSKPLGQIGFRAGDILEVSGTDGPGFHCEIHKRAESFCETAESHDRISVENQHLSRRAPCECSSSGKQAPEIV